MSTYNESEWVNLSNSQTKINSSITENVDLSIYSFVCSFVNLFIHSFKNYVFLFLIYTSK